MELLLANELDISPPKARCSFGLKSLHVRQIFLKIFPGTKVNLVSLQPDAPFHKDLVDGILARPLACIKVTNLRQAIV